MSKKSQTSHPSRQQLLAHLEKSDAKISRHVESCDDCRMILSIVAGNRTVRSLQEHIEQPDTLVERLLSTPALVSGPGPKLLHAAAMSDSWRTGQFAEVRQAAHGVERRLRFRAGTFTIDVVADRLGDRWEVSMRLTRAGAPLSHFMAHSDGRRVFPVDVGFFTWQSHRPPRRISVWSTDVSIELEPVGW